MIRMTLQRAQRILRSLNVARYHSLRDIAELAIIPVLLVILLTLA